MDKTTATTEQLTAAIQISGIALQAIREAGEDGIPSGVLYAAMMSVFRSIETYESMLALLIRSNCITRVSHILRAI